MFKTRLKVDNLVKKVKSKLADNALVKATPLRYQAIINTDLKKCARCKHGALGLDNFGSLLPAGLTPDSVRAGNLGPEHFINGAPEGLTWERLGKCQRTSSFTLAEHTCDLWEASDEQA